MRKLNFSGVSVPVLSDCAKLFKMASPLSYKRDISHLSAFRSGRRLTSCNHRQSDGVRHHDSIHTLGANDILRSTEITAGDCWRNNAVKKENSKNMVPRSVRLASQIRGKSKQFEIITAAYGHLADAAGPNSTFAQRAYNAEREKKSIEGELENLSTRLEDAIQKYSRYS
ncbi:hypothetical protein ElyMa_002511900 [Elysia marginata]|uniref:Uncharacterized protein n=1 Tax=Elysia marginata TaxID=1093978 RepID=A0AAV4GSY1_9GAST|nr:hypothetical protein ElyMa_002511900 [Elysia marginata]